MSKNLSLKTISLVIPAKNEKESLKKTLTELEKFEFIDEIIIVVDSRSDNSINIIKHFKTKKKNYIKLVVQKNNGYGSAIIEGFKHVSNEFGCIFNADYSFDPKYLKILISKTHCDFIFGSRYIMKSGSDDDTFITFIGNKIFSFLSKKFLKINLSDILFTYTLCNVKKLKKLKLQSGDFRLCVELPTKVKLKKFSYTEVAIKERKRYKGKKKVNELKDGFLILTEIIKFFFIKKNEKNRFFF